MPRGDGTGTMGMGSRQDEAPVYCTGAVQSGYGGAGFGYGIGFAGGMAGLSRPAPPATEKQLRKNQGLTLQAELE